MLVSELPMVMLRCLIGTIIVEVIGAIILGIREKKDLFNVILVNIVTNPIVASVPVYFNYVYGLTARNICLAILEIATVIIEGLIYTKVLNNKKINGFLISILLNIFSYAIGEIVNLVA